MPRNSLELILEFLGMCLFMAAPVIGWWLWWAAQTPLPQ